jgi:hypothetical protein
MRTRAGLSNQMRKLRDVVARLLIAGLCAAGGCATSIGVRFVGDVAQAVDPAVSVRSARSTEAGLSRRGLNAVELPVGTLVVAHERVDADTAGGRPSVRLEGYFFPSATMADIDFLNFRTRDAEGRSRVAGAHQLRGTLAVLSWGEYDFRIKVDAVASDPQQTRITGTLRTYTRAEWSRTGLMPP